MLAIAILLPAWWRPPLALVRIAQDRVHFAARQEDVDRRRRRRARRLDAVVDGVLQQRLQHERRHQRVGRHALSMFQSTVSRSPRRSFSSVEVLAAQLDLVGQRRELAVVAHQHAEQVRHVLQRGLGAPRVAAHERQHRVDAVEEEVRPDARLQRLQPRLGDRRRQRLARAARNRRAAQRAISSEKTMSRDRRGRRAAPRPAPASDDVEDASATPTRQQQRRRPRRRVAAGGRAAARAAYSDQRARAASAARRSPIISSQVAPISAGQRVSRIARRRAPSR